MCGIEELVELGPDFMKEELNCVLDRFAAGAHRCLSLTIPNPDGATVHTVPINYRQAHARPDVAQWVGAEQKEIQGLIDKVFEWRLKVRCHRT